MATAGKSKTAAIREEDGWLIDARNNKANIAYFSSREMAEAALKSLKDCDECINCSGCSGCSRCSYCSRCSDCSDCSRCWDCWGLRLQKNIQGKEGENEPPAVPTIPNIHTAIFQAASQPEALEMDSWHTCENTHCRAGWAVTLAGAEGKELEAFYNTELAAMMIYDASDPSFKINPARFYDKNDAALADMKRLAEREAA